MTAFWRHICRPTRADQAFLPAGHPIVRIACSLLALTLFLLTAAASAAVTSFVEVHKQGVSGVTGLRTPVAVAVSPDGATVYVAGYDYTFSPSYTAFGTLAVFSRNPATNQLTPVEVIAQGTNGVDGLGTAARSVAVSPDGNHVYGISSNSIAVFQRNPATGELTWIEMHKDGVNGVDGLGGAWGITVSLDGNSVYTTSAGDSSVAVFARESSTGALTFLEYHKDGVNGVDGLGFAYGGLAVSSDNKNLYATGYNDHGLAVFTRDPATGLLTFLEAHKDGVSGVDGLGNPGAVSISPDGASAYVSSELDSAVAFFNRDTDTGVLTFVETYVNGVNGVSGLAGAWWNAVSSDGTNFYSNGYYSNSLAVFRRNTVTGKLTYIEKHTDNVASVDGLSAAWGLAASPDGQGVFVTASGESALSIFSMPYTDLSVVKTDSSDPVDPASALAYQVTITNYGTNDASGVAIVDTLPATVGYVSATPDQGACAENGGTVTCELGVLLAGVSTRVAIDVSSGAAGMINNIVSVFGNEYDDNISNNSDQEDTTVNTAPTASGNSFTTLEDVSASGTLSANDNDGDSLIYTLVANGGKGTAVITNNATGAFTYTPAADLNGSDSFTFRVNDSIEDSSIATVSVTINPVQDAPTADNSAFITYEEVATSGTLSATDKDGDTLTYQVVTNGSKGTALITNTLSGT
ncbi:MAG: beta-propeller fold lactonase family protein, partial [Gammaproteobacteria bacterium]